MSVNRRWVLPGAGEGVVREDGAVPKVTETGVLIKVLYCGVCRFDIHCLETGPLTGNPTVLGHEICGKIIDIGEKAKCERPDLAVGDAVVVNPCIFCGACAACKADMSMLCREPPPYHFQGFFIDGGYQDYLVSGAPRNLVKLPSGVAPEVAAVSACSALTAYINATKVTESVERAIKLFKKARVLVVGVGGCGLWAIQFVRLLWGDDVTICTVSSKGTTREEKKMELAKWAGADLCATWEREGSADEAVALVKDKCGQFDAVLDWVSSESTAQRIIPLLNKGATWGVLGGSAGNLGSVNATALLMNNIRIQGAAGGTTAGLETVLGLLQDKKIRPLPLEIYEFDELPKALDRLNNCDIAGRAVLKLNGGM